MRCKHAWSPPAATGQYCLLCGSLKRTRKDRPPASPTDAGAGPATRAISAQVGLPSAEAIEAEIMPMSYEGADLTECVERILSLIRPAFEAKEREIGLAEQRAIRAEASRDALMFDCKTEQGRALVAMEARALSAEAKLAQAVEELSGLRQAILDAAVICDDDEKAGDRLDRLARAMRARSASARGET